jgi:hypothetical protein
MTVRRTLDETQFELQVPASLAKGPASIIIKMLAMYEGERGKEIDLSYEHGSIFIEVFLSAPFNIHLLS